MTDSEILAKGELCAALLSSTAFKTIVTEYELTIASDILSTAPADKAKREELYASLWGARGLQAYMQLNADAAQTILNPTPPEDSTTETVGIVEYDEAAFQRAEEEELYS